MGDKKWKVVFGADGSVSDDEVYSQRVTIFNSKSEVIGIFKGSSTPNPFKPSNTSISGEDAYPHISNGKYALSHGTHKGKPALVVNNNGFVPTKSKNPNFPDYGKRANFIHVHWGYKPTWKGSAGCPTIHPGQWKEFLSNVPSGVGELVIP
ncbi:MULTISPECIES: hypothetical protein [Photobacterium]|uniref:YkuD domain-containing protein n=1 Tax=Photobacterium sanguinicancri TaxID=875932 RepID=A0ABX4FS89_9GAMM|nr:hypothetical protein [Photobacterium sanguinicancri]MDO6498180.1 hypothetical protein [Photobacterium sanguinicancri]OZS41490.1 hypothetical protein ASV53_23435 [Photobacterium sanguinicancri]